MTIQNKSNMELMLDKPLREVLQLMQNRIIEKTTWFGTKALKNPLDFWIYQEILFSRQPDVIVEIGNHSGGSALALAHLCDILGKGKLICIDITHDKISEAALNHSRITFIQGDAVAVFDEVRKLIPMDASVLIIEDSSHEFDNTFNILKTYSSLVGPGDYFIVEDTICRHGLEVGPEPGPYEAVMKFLKYDPMFEIDADKESFLITWNPCGFLRRKASFAAESTCVNGDVDASAY